MSKMLAMHPVHHSKFHESTPALKYALKRCAMTMPGSIKIWWKLLDMFNIGEFTPRSFESTLLDWLNALQHAPKLTHYSPRRILCVAHSPWVELCVAISVILCSRNCKVDIAWLDNNTDLDCSLEDQVVESVYQHHYQQYRFGKGFAHHSQLPLRFIRMSAVDPNALPAEMYSLIHEQTLLDLVRICTKEVVDIDEAEKVLYERRKHRNLDAASRVYSVLQRDCYDSVLIPNGKIFESGAVYQLIKYLGLQMTTFDYFLRGGIAVANDSCVMDMDTSMLWEQDEPHILTTERRQRVRDKLHTRQQKAPSGQKDLYQPAFPESADEIRSKLGLTCERPVALICPNVPFDSSFLGRDSLFSCMSEWLIATVSHLKLKAEVQVVIRAHPAEQFWKSRQTTERILQENHLLSASNIYFVAAHDPINTYSLMQIADLGIVYSSSTGMEMPLFGLPVVCGNFFHYNRKGFTIDPPTRKAFFDAIDLGLSCPERLTERQIELAWCYADVFFCQWPQPFPWTLGWMRQDLTMWPMQRVLSVEGQSQYGKVFDQLAGRVNEDIDIMV